MANPVFFTARSRDHLPAIGFLGKDAKHFVSSPTPLVSPPIMYSSQPSVPYSYGTPAGSTGSLQSGYISPPESRRTLEEDKEKQQVPPARQSLPSIHEALGNDNPLPYHNAPTSAPPQQVHHAPPHTSSPGFVGRSGREGPPGPSNPFNPSFSHPHPHHQLQGEPSRSSLASMNTQDSRNASLQSFNSTKSPAQSAKTGITSISGSQVSPYEYNAPPPGNTSSPTGYAPPFSQSFTFSSHPPPNAPSYPPAAPYDARPYPGTPWKSTSENVRMEEMKNGYVSRPSLPGHGDSMKRHLEVYDVEASLNEVCIILYLYIFLGKMALANKTRSLKSAPAPWNFRDTTPTEPIRRSDRAPSWDRSLPYKRWKM